MHRRQQHIAVCSGNWLRKQDAAPESSEKTPCTQDQDILEFRFIGEEPSTKAGAHNLSTYYCCVATVVYCSFDSLLKNKCLYEGEHFDHAHWFQVNRAVLELLSIAAMTGTGGSIKTTQTTATGWEAKYERQR